MVVAAPAATKLVNGKEFKVKELEKIPSEDESEGSFTNICSAESHEFSVRMYGNGNETDLES